MSDTSGTTTTFRDQPSEILLGGQGRPSKGDQSWGVRLALGDTVYDPAKDYAAGYTQVEYDTWLRNSMADPLFVAAQNLWGKQFLAMAWHAEVNGWDDATFQGNIFAQGWSVGDAAALAQRSFGSGGGGASRADQLRAAQAAIKNQARTLGYMTLTDEEINNLANTVVAQNWSGEQLNEYLVNAATGNWDALGGGSLRAGVDAIKAAASAQLIDISDATAREWSIRMNSGELDADGLRSMIQQQAAARYGWAADVIAQGISMRDFLAPSRDRIARELEIDANTLDLTDPRIMSMMTVTDPNGQQRVANDVELIRNARKDERWKSTSNARETTAQATYMLRRYLEGS